MMNADVQSLFQKNILYLLISNVFFALYVITVGYYASSSNPSILAMGQMFFCFIFSFVLWIAEVLFFGVPFELPNNKDFWVGVVYISFFIRGIYGIVQIYAQRYTSPLNTSLIFSSEIVMTMISSPILVALFGTKPEVITPIKIAGAIIIVIGLLLIEPEFLKSFENVLHLKIKIPENIFSVNGQEGRGEKIFIIIISILVYLLMDIFVRFTEIMPYYAGIKNSLPFILGLFFGFYGVLGNCLGCLLSSLILSSPINETLSECWCIIAIGLCMFYGWHYFSKSHRIHFKNFQDYLRYFFLITVSCLLCFNFKYMISYFICGLFLGLLINILFGSLLYINPFLPGWCVSQDDAYLTLKNTAESLEKANEILSDTAELKGIKLSKIFEIQSCLEELSIRIFKAIPDTKIKIRVIYYDAISMRLNYSGEKYNPFKIYKNEDVFDIASLKIIKHRALRASFSFFGKRNKIHVVM